MNHESEEIVLDFFKLIGFPGIRKGEADEAVCKYLKSNYYAFTPDLVAGTLEIEKYPVEGLFFIDVIQPTSDLLFKSEFYEKSEIDVPGTFKNILEYNNKNGSSTFIDMLPNSHHVCYLQALNKKLDKYAHQRKFNHKNMQYISANFGLVHHFNLGEYREGKLSDAKKIITLLDYIRFYKRLSPSDNIDLKHAENLLLQEIVNEQQDHPYILAIGREWNDVPCLFYLIHIALIKQSKMHHLALISLNTAHLDKSDGSYPVHKWFAEKIFHPKSQKYSNDNYNEKKVVINIEAGVELFS